MNFKELLDQDRRLVILRSLIECQGSANESIIQDCLIAYGHKISRDLVRTYLDYLSEHNLVRITNIAGLFVACITARGEDVAQGYARHHGVKKPRATSYD